MPKQSNKWLTVHYQPVSLFSLKRSDATSMAAKSNLVPTPYSIQMALLKVLIESQGNEHKEDFEEWIESEFKWIKDLDIYIQPPKQLIVNRNGYKLRYWNQQADKDYRKANNKQPPNIMPMQGGFVFREWIYMQGNLSICCGETEKLDELEKLFSLINFFGKKGCFFQYLPNETQKTEQPQYQTDMTNSFTVQPMDKLGRKSTFNRINPYSSEKATLKRDRIIQPGFLPLKLTATSTRYDLYTRTTDQDPE
ncbi:hypothetical protein Xen7305DRAFT_00039490 [Xenococcus sp. PCC 7305]|uniref:hypothetical protein n=1 Tax=Xenococcus sp. PCC 7305 TaxID=102125 RepID=UPI0002AC890F|nr:hypothetical protein [Xenococcus sp. PCC 7305]ELS04221.1 hypothetical protein Xen7305DRAFT_00039490 [Xenococcus sp. PCC 7305]